MENTKFKKFNIYTFFIIVAAVCGMALSLIVPISQTPDEGMHFYNMLMSYGTMELYAEEVQFMESSGMASFNDDNEVKLVDEQAYYDAGMKKYSYDLKLSDFSLSTWALKFWPGAIGFYLGVFLKMPIIVCHQMAELFALIFYIIMGVITLKLIPFRKEVMLFIMLMPMVLQQAGSINPDVIVNSCSFLATAYILHLKFREKKVGWKDIIILGLLGLELLIAKEIYVLILAGIFIIPLDHFELKIGSSLRIPAQKQRIWKGASGMYHAAGKNSSSFQVLCAEPEGLLSSDTGRLLRLAGYLCILCLYHDLLSGSHVHHAVPEEGGYRTQQQADSWKQDNLLCHSNSSIHAGIPCYDHLVF